MSFDLAFYQQRSSVSTIALACIRESKIFYLRLHFAYPSLHGSVRIPICMLSMVELTNCARGDYSVIHIFHPRHTVLESTPWYLDLAAVKAMPNLC